MRLFHLLYSLRLATLLACLTTATRLSAAEPKPIDFAHEIAPVLESRCVDCHSGDKPKGDFSFDSRESLLAADIATPMKSGDSELLRRLTSTDPKKRMPPKGDPLTPKQIAAFKTWIDQGLAWEPGYTFKPRQYVAPLKLSSAQLPPAQEGREHPIDRLVDAYFAKRNVPFPPAVDDATFARRASADLVGLLPDPAQLQAFIADPATDKRERFINERLADQRAYADHWLTFWNDMLRNDYRGTGYIDGGRKQISAWLYQSLVDNKPYDQFVRELLRPSPESEGFINGIKWRGRVNASQVREVQFSQNVSQVFFGINMKCASCHDSFIDHWKLSDSYGLAAVIADRPLEIHRCDKPTGEMATAKFMWPELGQIDAQAPKERRLEQLAALVTHVDNGRFSRTMVNRLWQRMLGRGIVYPVDAMESEPYDAALLDYLAKYLVDNKYDLKKLMAHIGASRIYQAQIVPQAAQPASAAFVFRGPQVKPLTAEQFLDAVWQITGAGPQKPEAPVKLPEFAATAAPAHKFIRASLVNCDALMRSLGRPNREQVVTVRPDELTTLQALDLSNGQVLTSTLQRGAANLLSGKSGAEVTTDDLTSRLYWQALSRAPTEGELATARQFLGDKPNVNSVADLLWVVVMLPEFQLVR